MSFKKDTLAFIGCGQMGEALVKGILKEKLVPPSHIILSHPRKDRRKVLRDRYGVQVEQSNKKAVKGSNWVILTVKPQVLPSVNEEIRPHLSSNPLVVSIVAGVTMDSLCYDLGVKAVVRVMPNTPAQIGHGMSVWASTNQVKKESQKKISALLAALGEEIHFEREEAVDMATALSGTVPDYVFLFMETKRFQSLLFFTLRAGLKLASYPLNNSIP